ETDANDFLPRLWATRRVGWLMEQIRTNGAQKELVDEVVDLGTRYGIVTPYTSYLALEENAVTRDVNGAFAAGAVNGRRPPTNQPGATRGINDLGGAGAGAPPPKAAAESVTVTGESAVRASKDARKKQESLRIDADDMMHLDTTRKVADKTFYLRDGAWTDAEFKADTHLPETTLTFGTDAYFDALKREPKLADFFALGERVVVVYKGHVYRVNAATK